MRKELIDALPESISIEANWETRDVQINGEYLDPRPSQRIANHSPDGFNWSYGGSGPAQLALSICMKFLPLEEAQSVYQSFKFSTVAGWPKTDLQIVLNFKEEIKKILATRE